MRDASHVPSIAAKPVARTIEPTPRMAQLDQPAKGTWFRSELDLREPEGSELNAVILEQIARVENRVRALKPRDAYNRSELVRRIVANALACQFHRELPNVAFRATAAFYRHEPCWLNGASLAKTIELLQRCGLVLAKPGIWGRASSLYIPTRSLLKLGAEHGATRHSIVESVRSERLVRLRKSNSDGPEISFRSCEETSAWVSQLQAYNTYVAGHDLSVDASCAEVATWIQNINDDRQRSGLRLCRPELFRKSVYRTFNNGSFKQGGRMYGAWWINAPRSIRPSIKINGEHTVEYDYSGCAIRMLYHEKGIEYHGDPYRLDPLWAYASENSLGENHFRPAVKALMQALINSPRGVNPARARMVGCSVKPFSRRDVIEMIEIKHSEIAEAFGSGAGLSLQKMESDLALTIISNLMDRGILALPIHDSFRVEQRFEKELIEEMNYSYFALLGSFPCVKKDE